MSYRTYVNNKQIFGNNECYPEWLEFIKSQGISIDEECGYEGEITDVMGAVIAIEQIIEKIENHRRELIAEYDVKENNIKEESKDYMPTSIFDLRSNFDNYLKEKETFPNDTTNNSLTDRMIEIRNNGYIFTSCAFLDACKDDIEQAHCFSTPQHFYCYKIKEGHTIKVKAN